MTNPILLVARLYEHVEPMDRGSRYEDPLDAALRESGLGEVTGGGSQLGERGEIDFADIEIRVSNLDDALGACFHGTWQGNEETGLFFFGPDAEEMFSRIEPVLRALPIGQNARVVVRPGRDSSRHRSVRLPRK